MKNVPVFFWGFTGNLRTRKPNKSQTKWSNITVFLHGSTGGVNFAFYPLSSLHFTSSLFEPTSLFASATAGVCPPPGPGGHKKEQYRVAPNNWWYPRCHRASPPTTTLQETHLLSRLILPQMKTFLPLNFGDSSPPPTSMMTANCDLSDVDSVDLF